MDIRAHVKVLNEDRAKVWEKQKALLDDTTGRDRSAEEDAELVRMDAELDTLDKRIAGDVARHTRETESAAVRAAQEAAFGQDIIVPREEAADPNAELRAFLRGEGPKALEIDIRGARREMELIRAGASPQEVRALAWDTGSSASLVPTTLARSLYQYMEASVSMFRAPTTKITTSTGEALVFPKLAAHAIATQVSGQGTTLAGTDPSFAKMQLDAFKYGELVIVASEFLTDSAIDVASFLGTDMGRALGRKIDLDLVVGTGTGQPMGIMTAQSGSGTIATGGSLITPTVEKLIDLQYSVADEYRNDPSCAWLMNDSTAGTLRKLRDGAGGTVGAFLWQPSLTMGVIGGQPDRFLDKPVYTDTNVAAQASNAKTVAFGAMSAYYVRQIGNPVIESDASRYFDTDQVGFRAKWRVDGDCIDNTTGSTVGAINVIKQNV